MKSFKAQPSVPAHETEAVAPEGEKLAEIKRYQEAWRNYRILSGRYWIVFLTYIPGVLLLGGLLSFAVNDNLARGIVAFAWMALWIVAGQGYINFRCPGAAKSFFAAKGFLRFSQRGASTADFPLTQLTRQARGRTTVYCSGP